MIRVPSVNRIVKQTLYTKLIDFRNIFICILFPIFNTFLVSNYQKASDWSIFVGSLWTGIFEKCSFQGRIISHYM